MVIGTLAVEWWAVTFGTARAWAGVPVDFYPGTSGTAVC